ncbi:MAG: hypothetical protein ABI016_16150 [Chthoniobacterales bacterium]
MALTSAIVRIVKQERRWAAGAFLLAGGCRLTMPANGARRFFYSSKDGSDGNSSISNLVSDAAGNLDGTTSESGLGSARFFQLAPRPNGMWTESLPQSFQGSPDGAFPYACMVGDGAGSFYGATVHGGNDGAGAIYKFTP